MQRSQTITLRLPMEEVRKLTLLAAQRGTTKTAVIRSALKPVFNEAFGSEVTTISLNDAAFQSLMDYLEHGPDEETKVKRQHFIEKYRGWN